MNVVATCALVALVLVLMPSRRQNVYLNVDLTVGAPASLQGTQTSTIIDSARQQGCKIHKLKGSFDARGKTAAQGPVIIGFDVGLAMTEIEESYASDPQIMDDAGASERGNRKHFPVCQIPYDATGLHNTAVGQLSNNGWRNLRFPSWEILEGRGLNMYAINLGSGTLASGCIIKFTGVAITEWLDD